MAAIVIGLGIPAYLLATQDGIFATIGAILAGVILLPISGFMLLGSGIMGASGGAAKPASMNAGRNQYGGGTPVDISESYVPAACPNCNQEWRKEKFGQKIKRIGYDEFQDNRFQCMNCNHIEQIHEL